MAARRLIWTQPALDDLDEIAAWIHHDSPKAAATLVDRVFAALAALRRFPDSGRRVPEVGGRIYREVLVTPCRLIYRREGAAVVIVHVVRAERVLRPTRLR